MAIRRYKGRLAVAEVCGIVSLAVALLLARYHPLLAVLVLAGFLLLVAVAPFCPGWSFFLPVISRGRASGQAVALTFDDGPSPETTPRLLELLDRYRLPATFFLVGEKAAAHPELVAGIVAGGHSVGNHSWRHDHLLMLRSAEAIRQDIRRTQEWFKHEGLQPLVFRPPVGITGPRLQKALAEEGLTLVTYSCRAMDRGNRSIARLAERIMRSLRPGDIIMLHDLPPSPPAKPEDLWREFEQLFALLRDRYEVVPLSELIGRPVWQTLPSRRPESDRLAGPNPLAKPGPPAV